MASQVTNYQCPACTGPLHFDGLSGKLQCDFCGSVYEVSEIEALYAAKDEEAAEAMTEEETAAEEEAAEIPEGWESESADWNGEAEGVKVYNCPSCGAELICDDTTAAASCPYCGNPTIVPGQFSGIKKPDLIIPFKLDKAAAMEALKNHYRGKPLLPTEFANSNHIEEIRGVYVPFWLFDGTAKANVSFKAYKKRIIDTPREQIIETEHFDVVREGTVAFQQVPVDASTKMPDGHMDAIEPFDYSELKPFSTAYLPGYYADKYDVDSDTSEKRAEERCRESAVAEMTATVNGYDGFNMVSDSVSFENVSSKYALMPVWLLNTSWNGKNFLFAMNGQTGKLIGDLPVSMKKFWLFFAAIFAPLTAILLLLFGM